MHGGNVPAFLKKQNRWKNDIKNLWDKYRDILPYGVFGVLTTIVNIGTYWFICPSGGRFGDGQYGSGMDCIGTVCLSDQPEMGFSQ